MPYHESQIMSAPYLFASMSVVRLSLSALFLYPCKPMLVQTQRYGNQGMWHILWAGFQTRLPILLATSTFFLLWELVAFVGGGGLGFRGSLISFIWDWRRRFLVWWCSTSSSHHTFEWLAFWRNFLFSFSFCFGFWYKNLSARYHALEMVKCLSDL